MKPWLMVYLNSYNSLDLMKSFPQKAFYYAGFFCVYVSASLSHGKKFSVVPVFVKKQFELWIPMLGHYLVFGLDSFNGQLGGMTCLCWHDARIMGNWWDEFVVVSLSKTNSTHIFHLLTVCSVKATGKASLTNWLW